MHAKKIHSFRAHSKIIQVYHLYQDGDVLRTLLSQQNELLKLHTLQKKRVREKEKEVIQKIDTTQGGFVEVVRAFFSNQIHIVYVHQEELNHRKLLIHFSNVIYE